MRAKDPVRGDCAGFLFPARTRKFILKSQQPDDALRYSGFIEYRRIRGESSFHRFATTARPARREKAFVIDRGSTWRDNRASRRRRAVVVYMRSVLIGEDVWPISICLGCGWMLHNDAINNVAKRRDKRFALAAVQQLFRPEIAQWCELH